MIITIITTFRPNCNFLSVNQQNNQLMSFYTLRRNVKPSGLRVEHRFLSHPHTTEQAKRSIWARLTERLMTVKVDFSTELSKIYSHTLQPSLEPWKHSKERHVYEHTATLQATRRTSNESGMCGCRGEIKCLWQRLMTGF